MVFVGSSTPQNLASGGKGEAQVPHPTTFVGNTTGTRLRCVFLNTDELIGFDIFAGADGAAGPEHLDCLNSGVTVYTEDSGQVRSVNSNWSRS